MAFTKRSLETVRAILRNSSYPYVSIEDGWLAARNDHVIYAFRPNVLNGSGWVAAKTIDYWFSLTKNRKLIKLVEVWGWNCAYWVSGTFDPVCIKGIPVIPTLPTVQQMLRPFEPKTFIAGIDTLNVFRRRTCNVVAVDCNGFRPAEQSDKLLYDSKYIEIATKALRGRTVRLWLAKQDILVIQAVSDDAMFLIAPMRLE